MCLFTCTARTLLVKQADLVEQRIVFQIHLVLSRIRRILIVPVKQVNC